MSLPEITPSEAEALFTESEKFRFAKWGRPIAPVVFGVDDESLTHIKSALSQTIGVTGNSIAETDPELGANFMWFFCSEWSQISTVPDLDRLIPNLDNVLQGLEEDNANSYRSFGFDKDGAIQLVVVFTRLQGDMAKQSIQTLVTGEVFQTLALWSPDAFKNHSPLAIVKENNICVVKPEYAALMRAIYAPEIPVSSDDAALAYRIAARASLIARSLELDA